MLPDTTVDPLAEEDIIDGIDDDPSFELQSYPNKTYRLLDNGTIGGYVDSTEAVRQAIHCILNTEAGKHLIYDEDYGIELEDLYGMPQEFVISELQMRFEDALLQDERIQSLNDFTVERKGKKAVVCSFTAETTEGEIEIEEEVDMDAGDA
nr:DUF2634 domain-containing protein [uncultured Anaerostipes sp.]